jgi:hypothetical protein
MGLLDNEAPYVPAIWIIYRSTETMCGMNIDILKHCIFLIRPFQLHSQFIRLRVGAPAYGTASGRYKIHSMSLNNSLMQSINPGPDIIDYQFDYNMLIV